jgi:hypothetical protein
LRNFSEAKMQDELMSHQNLNYIPTIVNGEVNETKQENEISSNCSKWNYIYKSLNESTAKLFEIKAKYLECCKYKVLIKGDSHMRGRASRMTASLDARFDEWYCETRIRYWVTNGDYEG